MGQRASPITFIAGQAHPGIALRDGTTTPVYDWLKVLNRDFVAIAGQTQNLRSIGVFHVGMQPPGAVVLSADSSFRFDPAVSSTPFKKGERVQGLLLGSLGQVASHRPWLWLSTSIIRTAEGDLARSSRSRCLRLCQWHMDICARRFCENGSASGRWKISPHSCRWDRRC